MQGAASFGPGRPVMQALRTLRLSRQQGAQEAAAAQRRPPARPLCSGAAGSSHACRLPQPAMRAGCLLHALPAGAVFLNHDDLARPPLHCTQASKGVQGLRRWVGRCR